MLEIYKKFLEKKKEIKKERDNLLDDLEKIKVDYDKCLLEENKVEADLEKIEKESEKIKDKKELKEIAEKRLDVNKRRRSVERKRWEIEDRIKITKKKVEEKDRILELLEEISNKYKKLKEKELQYNEKSKKIDKEWDLIKEKIRENVEELVEEEEEEEEDRGEKIFSSLSFEDNSMEDILKSQMEKLKEMRRKIEEERSEIERLKKEAEKKKEELESKRKEIEGKSRWVLREKERITQEKKEKEILAKKESTKNIFLEKTGETPPPKETAIKVRLTEGEIKKMPSVFQELEEKSKKKSNIFGGILITILVLIFLGGLGYGVFYFKDKISLISKQKIVDCKTDQGCFEENFRECKPAKFYPSLDLGILGGVVTYYYEIIEPVDRFCSIKTKFLKNPNPEWVNKEMICKYDNQKDFQTSVQETFNNIKDMCEGPLKDIMLGE